MELGRRGYFSARLGIGRRKAELRSWLPWREMGFNGGIWLLRGLIYLSRLKFELMDFNGTAACCQILLEAQHFLMAANWTCRGHASKRHLQSGTINISSGTMNISSGIRIQYSFCQIDSIKVRQKIRKNNHISYGRLINYERCVYIGTLKTPDRTNSMPMQSFSCNTNYTKRDYYVLRLWPFLHNVQPVLSSLYTLSYPSPLSPHLCLLHPLSPPLVRC